MTLEEIRDDLERAQNHVRLFPTIFQGKRIFVRAGLQFFKKEAGSSALEIYPGSSVVFPLQTAAAIYIFHGREPQHVHYHLPSSQHLVEMPCINMDTQPHSRSVVTSFPYLARSSLSVPIRRLFSVLPELPSKLESQKALDIPRLLPDPLPLCIPHRVVKGLKVLLGVWSSSIFLTLLSSCQLSQL